MSSPAQGARPRFRRTVLSTVLLAALTGSAGWHHAAFAAGSLDTVSHKTYNIPAGPLGKTLSTFALDAGIALSFEPALTEGLSSPGVSGNLAARDAVARLLAGSGLEIVARTDGTYTLRKQAAQAGAAGVQNNELPAITVAGDAIAATTTEGTGSYTTRATGAGTRMPLSLRETPQSVTVIGRQQIQDQNLMTLVDVLRQTPGIVADRLDERVTFSSRGFALNTMIDGVPTLAFNTVAGESSMINTMFYDRVEVVRGAAGLLNGSGSPGGSINLVRKRPGTEFAGHVTAGIGSWNRYLTEADLGGSLNAAGTLRGRVAASHADGNSFVNGKKQSDDVFYGIVEADLARDTMLSAGYEYERTAITGANFGQSPLFYANGAATNLPRSFNSSAPWSTWNMQTERLFVNLDQRFDSGWKLKVDAAYAKNKRERYSADLWLYPANISAANTGTVQVANNPADSTNKSLDVYATGPFSLFGRTHEAVAGFNINQYSYYYGNEGAVVNAFDRRSVNIFNLGAVAQPNFTYPLNKFGGEAEEKALYGAVRFKPVDSLSLLIGGRLSWYDNKSYQRVWTNGTSGALVNINPVTESSVFTPYAGIVYDLSKEYSVYASYTDIFQPNTVRDTSNQIISPKRGTNTELGIKGEHFGGKLNTAFAVFQTEEDNATEIAAGAPLLPDGTTPYRAVKGARTKGYEATISGEVIDGLQLMAGYTYSAKFSNKNVLMNPTYPQRMFRLATSYRLPGAWSKLTIGGNLSYQSSIYYDESYSLKRATQGGMTLIGLMARYDFTRQFNLSLNIENLTDKYYYTGLGGYNGYTYGNPRNAWLKATYSF